MHWACQCGRTEIVLLFITSSKDFSIDLTARDRNRSSALHLAYTFGITEIVQFMITSSKDLNARGNEGWSDLHCACIFVRTETVEVMVKNWKEFGMDIKGFRFSVIIKIKNIL